MTQPNPKDLLEKLKDTDLEFADSDQDLRNRRVTDLSGKHIGHVIALFVDRQDRKIRFLQVGAGGFLGIGEREFLFLSAMFLFAGTVSTNLLMFVVATLLVLAWRTAGYWGFDRFALPWIGVPGESRPLRAGSSESVSAADSPQQRP